jgi:O-antigen/teichoic acid export membrane protein
MFKNAQIRNILWMFIDKAFLLVGSFIVSVMVARYLGPENYGLISYGLALSTFIIAICQWGANYTIFDSSVKNSKRSAFYIRNTERSRIFLFFILMIIIDVWLFIFGRYDLDEYMIVVLVVFSQIFLALDIYQFHYNGMLRSKINAISSLIAKSVSMSLRVIFVFQDMNVIYFIIPFFIEGVIIYFIRRNKLEINNSNRRIGRIYNKHYFGVGIPLAATAICISLYTKVNEILIANIVSYKLLGIYSVTASLTYAWTFIPMSIGVSLLTKPLSEDSISEKIKGFSFITLITLISVVPILLFIYFFADEVVLLTFGIDYIESSILLFVFSFGGVFSVLGFITNRMINSFQFGSGFLLKKAIISSFVMLCISYFLVVNFGVIGAVWAIVISEFLSLTILNYFFYDRIIMKVHFGIFNSFTYFRKFI